MLKRTAIIAVCVIVAWFVLLAILGPVLAGREQAHVEERVGESLQATATVGTTDLGLVGGSLVLDRLAVRRDDVVGHLALDVDQVRCDLAPLGWALVDHDCRDLAIRGMRLEVSTAALFQLRHPARQPIRVRHVTIDDATLAFAPSAFVPSLGRVAITIEHAEAGDTVFREPLSWIFALETLRARIELPANITLRLGYAHGKLSAAGTLFGSAPVEVPFELPVAALAADPRGEIALLVKAGEDVAERLVEKRAEDWLNAKLHRGD
jgi:hypothetical protein